MSVAAAAVVPLAGRQGLEERLDFARASLESRGLSASTVRIYGYEARLAEEWCDALGYTLLNVPAEELSRYVDGRKDTRYTRRLMRSALGAYWSLMGRVDPPTWLLRSSERPSPLPRKRKPQEGESAGGLYWQMRRQGLAPLTISVYIREIRRVQSFAAKRGYTLDVLPPDVLLTYVERLPHSWSSRKLTRSALSTYWRLNRRPDPPLWIIRVPRKPRMVCRALSEEDAATLAAAARAEGGNRGMAVVLGMFMALRRAEIAAVRWDDVRPDGWLSLVGKGDLPARLPIHPVVTEVLATVERTASPWVFPGTNKGDHVCPTTVWTWVTGLAGEAGLDGVTTHRLRHTALATANDSTGDLRAVQDFARHARPETTAGYTRTTERRLVAVMESIDYPGPAGPEGEASRNG